MARGIIYITKTSCEVYIPTLANIIMISFPSTAVRDMDVLNEEELVTTLKTTFSTNKILPPLTLSLILAKNVLFEKEFPKANAVTHAASKNQAKEANPSPALPDPSQQQKSEEAKTHESAPEEAKLEAEEMKTPDQAQQIQSFLEHVPFEEVESVTINKPTAVTVVATNKELYTCIKSVVTKAGFIVDSVLPEVIFPAINNENGLTVANAQQLLSQVDSNKQYNLLKIAATFSPQEKRTDAKTGKEKPSNTRAIILAGVFGVLFLFMLILYYVMYLLPHPKSKAFQSIVPTPLPPLTVSVSPTAAASSESASLTNLKVQLMTSSSTASYAAEVKRVLAAGGVTTVETIPTNTSSNKTFVVFSSDISEAAKTAFITDLQKDFPSISSQDNTTTSDTVVITLGAK